MTAFVCTIAADCSWLSTDSLALVDGREVDLGTIKAVVQGLGAVAGCGPVAPLRRFAEAVLDGGDACAELAGFEATGLVLWPGGGWAASYEDGYRRHALLPGHHTLRPGFSDLEPADVCELRGPCADAAEGRAVEQFHLAYLRAARTACLAGRVRHHGEPSLIGGSGWGARLGEDGASISRLGPLS